MRKTKIICTLGPATDNEEVLEKLILEGMNVARLNFSHGTHEEHAKRIQTVRDYRKKHNKAVAILLDTKGPEIRTGNFQDGKVMLTTGQKFTLTCRDIEGTDACVSVTYENLYKEVPVGTEILIDDGLVSLEVVSVDMAEKDIHCIVKNDGVVSNHKGINIPEVHVKLPYMSEKDKQDILFGIQQGVDFIAASFVRTREDVKEIRTLLADNGGENIHIVAKIENRLGVDNIDAIIEDADAIMIARGDMGVELPEEEVPVVQKMIIRKAYRAGKQVITATQMLDSMMKNPRPTRAETTDVANAIYDGTSAIMLSGETAAGKYPLESLRTMIKIAERAEADINYEQRFYHFAKKASSDVTDAICHATCTTAYDLNAAAIVTVTKSGRSARAISKYRPQCMIIGGTTDERVLHQLNMSWGVVPVLLEEKEEVFDLFRHAIDVSRDMGLLKEGELIVITSGIPIGQSGTTNMLKVQTIE